MRRKERLLIFWRERVPICQVIKSEFCIEVEVEEERFVGKCWVIFIYTSTDDNIRKLQWETLKKKKKYMGTKMDTGREF